MRVRLFGNLRIDVAGQSLRTLNTNRLQSLIAYLILHGDTPQPREKLAFTLWAGSRESQARTNLRQLLHSLRRALPVDCSPLMIDHFAVHWRQSPSCSVDVTEFRAVLEEASVARAQGDGSREAESLKAAARLYEDDLLPALYDDWLWPLREEFRNKICDALYRLATLLEEQKECAVAIPYAERLLMLDSLAEPHHRLLIRLHAANHDRTSALRAYHQCMRVLRREMGVEPDVATKELFERILKSERDTEESKSGSGIPESTRPPSRSEKMRKLVGRVVEWNALTQAWQIAWDSGPHVAMISGEPGIGKTRLAEELYRWCGSGGHSAVRARCYAGQNQTAYAPVAAWLRSDPIRAGWNKLRGPHLAELARILPEIADQFPQVELKRSEAPSTLPENWQRLIFYESLNAAIGRSRKPLLLYLDDMQWCDLDSFEWLKAFLTSGAATGVLVLGTVRAEETGREHPFTHFLTGLRQAGMVSEVALERLTAQQTAELAMGESKQALERGNLEEIFHSTRGNPLFVLESVRAGSQSTRVQAVINARLAQLSAPAYEMAGLASVVGRPFSLELLAQGADWDERSVSNALEELWQRRIIESRGASEYDFSHDLLREVTYSELSLVRKRYLHRRLAGVLADAHREEIGSWNGQIASHFERAGMPKEAIEWLQRAAVDARKRYADREAAELLKRAMGLCGQLPDSDTRLERELDLLVALGAVLVTTEGYSASQVGATYNRALTLSRRFQDRNIFVVLSGAFVFHVVGGDLKTAQQFGLEFLRRAEQEPTPELVRTGNFLVGSSLFHLGQLEDSLKHINQAIGIRTGPESILALFAGPDVSVFCRSYQAHLTWHCGDERRAIAHAAEAVRAAKQMQHPFSEAIALDYATMLDVFCGDSRRALEHGTEAVELCRRYGFTYYLAMADILTGWARGAEGNPSGGLAQLREGLEAMRHLEAEIRMSFYLKLLAETLARGGLISEALANLSTGFALATKNSERWTVAELHRAQGELLAGQGKLDAARDTFLLGLEAARRSGSFALQQILSNLADGTPTIAAIERS